jgi:hypothetical protein
MWGKKRARTVREFRIWAIALSVVALIAGLPLAQAVAAATMATLTPATQTVGVDETTTVTLAVQDVQDLYGYEVEIAYDPAILEVVDADGGTTGVQVALGSWLAADFVFQNEADNTLGTIVCVLSQLSPTPAVSGNGDLLTITFRGLASGTSEVRFTDLTLANEDGIPISTGQADAQIEVTGGSPPASPTPTPTVEPPVSGTAFILHSTDMDGQTIVEVWVQDVMSFYAVDFTLHYDPSIVQGLSIVEGTAFTDYPSQCVVTESSIGAGVAHFAGNMVCIAPDGDLHLATITFADVSCGSSPLTWQDTQLSDNAYDPIPHTAQEGSVSTYACPAEVEGHALLEGRGDHSGIEISLVDGTSEEVLTGADGAYTFSDVSEGVYDLVISHTLYLAAEFVGCSIPGGETTTMPDVTLLGGDLDGNGVIDISDLVIGGSHFGSDSAEADITADGHVDIFDIVLIGKNFGLTGPIEQECP